MEPSDIKNLKFISDFSIIKKILENISCGVWVTDKHDRINYVNKPLAKIAGISMKQLTGMKIPDSFSAETMQYFFPVYNKAKKTLKSVQYKSLRIETPKKRKTLQSGWLIPILKDSKYDGMICTVNDTTYEVRYKELFEHTQNCVAVYIAIENGKDFIVADFNKAAERAEKVKRINILGRKITEVFPSVKDFGLFEVLQKVYKTGIPENLAVSFYKDERILGWRENHVYRISTGEVIAVYNNVTSFKKNEEELINIKESLKLAQISADSGVWDWDMRTGKLNWSQELFLLFGLDPSRDTATFDTWRKVLHPDDAATAEEKINAAVKEHRPLLSEYRIVLPSNEIRWINAFGNTKYEDSGDPLKMAGICIDITDKKNSLKAIQLSERRYHELFNRMFEGFAYCRMLYDETGRPVDWIYLDVNEKFETLTSLKNVIGRKITDIIPELKKSNPELFEIYGRVAKSGHPEIIEDYIIPLSIWLHISVFSPVEDYFITVFQNITEQHKSRKTIIDSNEKLQRTLKSTIDALASMVEIKDPYTSGHQIKVEKLSVAIAKELGLDMKIIEAISTAAIIHDIGKIMIPASILSKPSTLSDLEYSFVKTHPRSGYDIIKGIDFSYPIKDIVLQHHERLDGSGYPNSLKGNKIMLEAKIIAVADVVEAMASHRPYRPAIGIDEALKEIKAGIDILYDREIVNTCISLIKTKKFSF